MKCPLLLGHRGVRLRGLGRLASELPSENSLAAFECAMTSGCDGFEFDVRLSRDGQRVLWHDADYRGESVADAESHKLLDRNGVPLATLKDALLQFGDRAYLDIELKVSGNEELILADLQSNPPQFGYMVSSFLPEVLTRLHNLAPDLPLGFICDQRKILGLWRDLPVRFVLPQDGLVSAELIDEVHAGDRRIMAWTVNDVARMRELATWGIDGLISDDPWSLYQTFHPA